MKDVFVILGDDGFTGVYICYNLTNVDVRLVKRKESGTINSNKDNQKKRFGQAIR